MKEITVKWLCLDQGNKLPGYEIFNWYGSAALPEYLPASGRIRKSNP